MELTYKVRGADGKEYGPVTLLQITAWLREGRIKPFTDMTRSDIDYWAPAENFSELQLAPPPPVPSSVVSTQSGVKTASEPALERQMKSGASWFHWIAGLSLINSIVAFTNSSWGFVVGLGITRVLDGLAMSIGSSGKVVVLALNVVVAGVFVLFSVFAHKRHAWAFVVGMVLYVLDGLIFLAVQDWLGVGFHAFVLFCLFRGFAACRQLNA